VLGDSAVLLEILVSLLENAARYSPEREVVDITLEPTARGQMLIVRDRGPGVAESERERIFQATQDPAQGLHAARSCLERMNGTIRAQNHPEGGAMFICTIPGYSEAPRQLTVALTSRSG
jgi:two-component system sensor histidine kinase KdpD